MALSEFIKAQVKIKLDKFCDRVPAHVKNTIKISYSTRGNDVTLFEERVMMADKWSKMPIAKFKYDTDKNKWSLWWSDSKEKWHDYYKEIKCSKNPGTFDAIANEVDEDPQGIFWG